VGVSLEVEGRSVGVYMIAVGVIGSGVSKTGGFGVVLVCRGLRIYFLL